MNCTCSQTPFPRVCKAISREAAFPFFMHCSSDVKSPVGSSRALLLSSLNYLVIIIVVIFKIADVLAIFANPMTFELIYILFKETRPLIMFLAMQRCQLVLLYVMSWGKARSGLQTSPGPWTTL